MTLISQQMRCIHSNCQYGPSTYILGVVTPTIALVPSDSMGLGRD